MMKLYHYVHCPFCVRVRFFLGLQKIAYESIVLPYDDEETPLRLSQKKMLPIMEEGPNIKNESLDIIHYLDRKDRLNLKDQTTRERAEEFEALLTKLGKSIHSLAMPYWIYTPEFNDVSRDYFIKKKSEKRGPFKELVHRKDEFIKTISGELESIEKELVPFYENSVFGILDIMLASHLWGLYVVPEFQFSPALHNYLQNVKKICSFDYHQDFWK